MIERLANFRAYVADLTPVQRVCAIDFPPAHLVRVRRGFECETYPTVRKAVVTGYAETQDDKGLVVVQGYRDHRNHIHLLPAQFPVLPEGLVWEGQGESPVSLVDAFVVVDEVGLE